MRKVRITVMRKACYEDLMAAYENSIENACDMEVGQVFIANSWQKLDGLCQSVWDNHVPLRHGTCSRRGGLLRGMDEKSPLGNGFLQRWFSSCQLSVGDDG